MRTQLRRAGELRIGDRVICVDGPATVTSTRIEGVGGGTVSVGLTGRPDRSRYRPGDLVTVVSAAGAPVQQGE
jgi:hypothetical protein